MEKVKVLYSSGESRKNPGVGVDYMIAEAEEIELYAECKPNDDEYGTYESLRTAIIEQAKIVGIECEKLYFERITDMKKSIFYAVQHGDNNDWDYGSENHDEALKMAEEMVKEERYDGEQISIAKIDVNDSFCLEEEIIRDVSTVDTTTDWDW